MTTESQKAFEEFKNFFEVQKRKYEKLEYSEIAERLVYDGLAKIVWDAAWQARGEFDAKICDQKTIDLPNRGYGSGYNKAIQDCAQAIRKAE